MVDSLISRMYKHVRFAYEDSRILILQERVDSFDEMPLFARYYISLGKASVKESFRL